MNTDFNILISKLDAFIRRYYLNQILRGAILAVALTGSYFLLITIVEYFGHLGTTARTIIFYASVLLLAGVLFWFIIRPLLGFLKIGKHISYRDASRILRQHFPQMQDTLENSLELAEMAEMSPESRDLIMASVTQKTEKLKPLPFLSALPWKKSLTAAKYLVPPIIIILLVLFFWPSALSEGTQRLVKHRQEFVMPPPFEFVLENKNLAVKKGGDVEITVSTKGNNLPDKVWVHFGGNHLLMKKTDPNKFVHTFRNINNPLNIHFESSDVISDQYRINVLPAPALNDFRVKINPPDYTGEPTQELKNQGDLSVPAGSEIEWAFNTRSTERTELIFSDSSKLVAERKDVFFTADTSLLRSTGYTVSMSNEHFTNDNPLQYSIHVIPDMYPSINVEQKRDSSDLNIFYFNGVISDDYGFKSLNFMYNAWDDPDSLKSVPVEFNANLSPQEFYFARDFSRFADTESSSVKYYFEVGDNDAIHGSKTSRSNINEFRFPGSDELNKLNEETNQAIDDKNKEAQKLSESLQKDVKDLQRKLIDKNMSDWERKQSMEKINEKQNSLENIMQDMREQNKQRNQMMDSYSQNREDIRQKQEQVEKLMEELMDEEMKEMLEELNELMKNNQTDEMNELMEELDMSYEDLNKQLDNNLEMLKRTEVEQRMENTIDELQKLGEEHEKLSEKTKNKEASPEELQEEQTEDQKELEELKEEFEKTMEKNEGLKEPLDMENFDEQFEQIQQEMQKAGDKLDQKKENKASEHQQNSSEQMKQLSKDMQSMMEQAMMESASENMEDLKQLLDNLIQFSFDQEDLIEKFSNINSRDPRFKEIIIEQGKVRKSYQMINDSLTALGSRVPQIGGIMRKEQKSIRKELEDVMDEVEDNRLYRARTAQQNVMTHANNLALLLSEALDQMQQQMNSMANSNSSCKKKNGKGQPKMGEMRQRQQNLKKQMQEMLDMMKNGQKPGQKSGGKGQKEMSKQISKMMAEQEIMQQMLNDIMSEQNISPESAKMLQEIKRMLEDSKNELINRNITPDLLKRQEQILTRMLEAENSEFEREIDKQRKSEEARHQKISNPEEAFREAAEKESFNELLEFSRLKMTRFYKEKYKEYLLKISN
ncbi:MAG: DUF4175 family protein [Bacteroidales bacterium]